MAKKKTAEKISIDQENIIDVEYSEVMQKSYIDYSMSVIQSRAVPDVRDGLKPVQRRILYDMQELGTTSDKPFRKSARIVGDTMGKYHPHGDGSIYGALVVMAQEFKYGRPLTDGHGNFGSIEGDGAAAMRYTEVRLQKFTEDAFLSDLKNNTVDFIPNFDETEKEPSVLPCKVPNLLINGSEGIAVGMTTNIPPHNTDEVIDTAIYYGLHKEASDTDLLQILHGPDFPTGGIVSNASELEAIYSTGQGKIKIRGKIELEKQTAGKYNLVITEIPYTIIGQGIQKLLFDIAALVENRTIPEIIDISNQSSKEGTRIVLELRRGAEVNAENIINILYKKTKLEDTFGVNMLAIDDGRPATMSLSGIMKSFWSFQEQILKRKSQFLLDKALKRQEVNDGLVKAIDCIDLIIEILRGSKDIKMAKACLVNGVTDGIKFKTKKAEKDATKLRFTDVQATAILEMRLSRLIGLELEAILSDIDENKKNIDHYSSLLNDVSGSLIRDEIIEGLQEIKKKYPQKRRTEITDAQPIVIQQQEEPEAPVVVLMDRFSYAHVIDASVYEKNKEAIEADFTRIIPTTNKSKLIIFTDTGKMHTLKIQEIPAGKLRDKGQPLDNLCNYESRSENIVAIFSMDGQEERSLIFISSDGLVKKVPMTEFDVSRKTIDASKLNGATIVSVFDYNEKGQVILESKEGYYIRFNQVDIPGMKKNSAGAKGLTLGSEDAIARVYPLISRSAEFIRGEEKYTADRIKLQKRGGKGVKARL